MLHTEEYKGCVVVQGPVHKESLGFIRRCWHGYKLIYSTWEGVDTNDFLSSETVIINKMPEFKGVLNSNLQKISTASGLNHAKDLGWKRAFKWRFDMHHSGPEFLKWFHPTKLNVYAWCTSFAGHITDYFYEGEIDDLLKLYDYDLTGPFPEHMITKNIYKYGLNSKIHCVGNEFGFGGDVYWYGNGNDRQNFWLSSKHGDGVFINEVPESWDEHSFDKLFVVKG